MIYVTEDTHGDFRRLSSRNFPGQKGMGREDHVIVCGDFGGVWADTAEERYWLEWLDDKPFTALFVDGNHENFDRLNQLPEEGWNGGRVHRVRPSILHLTRGQLYEIDGRTFFTMGGASSHNIQDGILDPGDPFFVENYRRKRRLKQMFRILGVFRRPFPYKLSQ